MAKVEFEVSTEWCAETLKELVNDVRNIEIKLYSEFSSSPEEIILLMALTDYKKKMARKLKKEMN